MGSFETFKNILGLGWLWFEGWTCAYELYTICFYAPLFFVYKLMAGI